MIYKNNILPLLFAFVVLYSYQEVTAQTKVNVLDSYENAETPVLFYPGAISINGIQWNNALSRKNKVMFYCQQLPTRAQLVYQEFNGRSFNSPETIPFDTIYNYSDPYVNSKGDHMIFMANIPYRISQDSVTSNFQLWQSHQVNKKWGKPEIVFPTAGSVGYPWRAKDSTLFFSMMPLDGSGKSNIYYAPYNNKKYSAPRALPDNVNSKNRFEGDAYISPDKDFLIFVGFDRSDSQGYSDLYITFRIGENQWTDPKSLGSNINSAGYDGSPYVTDDGRFLLFTSSRNSPGNNSFFNTYIVRFDKTNYMD